MDECKPLVGGVGGIGVVGGVGGFEGVTGLGGELCQPLWVPLKPVEDLNPLKPCGACKEWLNKISEVNPGFKAGAYTRSLSSST